MEDPQTKSSDYQILEIDTENPIDVKFDQNVPNPLSPTTPKQPPLPANLFETNFQASLTNALNLLVGKINNLDTRQSEFENNDLLVGLLKNAQKQKDAGTPINGSSSSSSSSSSSPADALIITELSKRVESLEGKVKTLAFNISGSSEPEIPKDDDNDPLPQEEIIRRQTVSRKKTILMNQNTESLFRKDKAIKKVSERKYQAPCEITINGYIHC